MRATAQDGAGSGIGQRGLGAAAAPVERAGEPGVVAANEGLGDAFKTARRAGHELNNKLLLVTGYGDLLAERLAGSEHAEFVRRMVEAADAASEVLDRLQSIIRLEQRRQRGTEPHGVLSAER
ncbi:MAG TPA: hypothetical protein VG370_15555 [Chloroflexota bacterium]|nr:hypothetical protein [Chloroflexota bacterium]